MYFLRHNNCRVETVIIMLILSAIYKLPERFSTRLRLFYFMTYSKKLQDPRWQKKRLEVFERDRFTCQLCEDKSTTLNVHHEKYFKNPWDAELNDLITLCKNCHTIVEDLKKVNCRAVHIEKNNKYYFVYVTNECDFYLSIYLLDDNEINIVIIFERYDISRANSILNSL